MGVDNYIFYVYRDNYMYAHILPKMNMKETFPYLGSKEEGFFYSKTAESGL